MMQRCVSCGARLRGKGDPAVCVLCADVLPALAARVLHTRDRSGPVRVIRVAQEPKGLP